MTQFLHVFDIDPINTPTNSELLDAISENESS